ncbi:MAG: sulfur carrier protein ThiS adenylyltransferase ThiF, partial [Desulfuromonadales bacterium]|nr:sulfur carrier protein ThiS adenylyltransferase ThiF [Desulfuromonadales bacterium]
MLIYLNENSLEIKTGSNLYELRDHNYVAADLLIVNGYPATTDMQLHDGDRIVMIQRGKQPSAEELESLMMA